MSYVILDLEWNGAYSKSAHRFVNEIIEFGAVKTDEDLAVTDTFSALISPRIGKRLSGRVKELTKLTNEALSDGADFGSVVQSFGEFAGDSVIMPWGTSDIHALIDNCLYYYKDRKIPFLHRYCDMQEYCERAMNRFDEGCQMGLGLCAERLGVEFSEDDQHRAGADALLSLKCLKALRGARPLDRFVQDADSDAFYDRMTFKNHYITDLGSPDIDRSALKFNCDVCGKRARRIKSWRLHNRNFTADFICKNCGRAFTGRVSFKKRYDGVRVNKRIVEKKEEEANTSNTKPNEE